MYLPAVVTNAKGGAVMFLISPMTSKPKSFLPPVINQSKHEQKTRCHSKHLLHGSTICKPPTNLPQTHDRHAHFFSVTRNQNILRDRSLHSLGCWSWVRAGHGRFYLTISFHIQALQSRKLFEYLHHNLSTSQSDKS